MHLLSGIEYKGWWLMVVQVLLIVITDPLSTVLAFSRFGSVGSWSMERMLLIYFLAVTAFGMAETFCRGFDYFPWHMVRNGEFDRVLLRPRSLFVQVAASRFHIHRLARVGMGLVMIVWLLRRLEIPFTAVNLALLVLSLLGGLLMYCGVFVMCSGLSFFTVRGLDWIFIFTNASYQVARIPIGYMPRVLRYTFTFLVPMLVVSYYPASAMGGWGESLFLGFLALPAGVLFLLASLWVWRFGVRHYQSTGS